MASVGGGGFRVLSFVQNVAWLSDGMRLHRMLLSLWRADIDVIVPITKEDGVRVKKLGDLGYKLPKIADVGNLIQTVKY